MNRLDRRCLALSLGLLVSGCVASNTSLAAAEPDAAAGHRLYRAKCSMCHELVDPEAFSKQEWPRLLEKYGQRARLKPADQRSILAYLEEASR
jgi:cytochrome c5